jgi:hypothetical protein
MAGHEHTCAHHESFDPETLEPRGPACGKPATQELYWHDGRVSPSCPEHGMKALDADARALVVRVTHPTREDQWATMG